MEEEYAEWCIAVCMRTGSTCRLALIERTPICLTPMSAVGFMSLKENLRLNFCQQAKWCKVVLKTCTDMRGSRPLKQVQSLFAPIAVSRVYLVLLSLR